MTRLSKLLGLAGLAAMAAGPALAHHSAAMFDAAKTVTITGVVKEYHWQNPHASLDVAAADAALWSVEMSTPNILVRKGWSIKSFQPGDKVSIVMHPMKDGGKAGLLMNVTNAKGAVLKDHDY